MSEASERKRRSRLRWITLGETVAIAAVAISGLTFWNSYQDRRDARAEKAVEAARVAEVLAGQVRDWIGRAVDRLGPQAPGLAYSGGADRDAGRDGRQDLAARMRAAWEARQTRTEAALGQTPEPESARSLAERLREATQGIDRGTLAGAAARLQEGREAEERQRVQEAERLKQQERQREQEREERHRDKGIDHGL